MLDAEYSSRLTLLTSDGGVFGFVEFASAESPQTAIDLVSLERYVPMFLVLMV